MSVQLQASRLLDQELRTILPEAFASRRSCAAASLIGAGALLDMGATVPPSSRLRLPRMMSREESIAFAWAETGRALWGAIGVAEDELTESRGERV